MSNNPQVDPSIENRSHFMSHLIPESIAGKAAAVGILIAGTLGATACGNNSVEATTNPTIVETSQPINTQTAEPSPIASPTPSAEAVDPNQAIIEQIVSEYKSMETTDYEQLGIKDRVEYLQLGFQDDIQEYSDEFYEATYDSINTIPEEINENNTALEIIRLFRIRNGFIYSIQAPGTASVDINLATKVAASIEASPLVTQNYQRVKQNIVNYNESGVSVSAISAAHQIDNDLHVLKITDNGNDTVAIPEYDGVTPLIRKTITIENDPARPGVAITVYAYWVPSFTNDEGITIEGTWVRQLPSDI